MQIPLLILGIFVHGLFLWWSHNMYGESNLVVQVSCPFDIEDERRLVLLVVRSPNQRGPINGLGSRFFDNMPSVVYFGNIIISEYYNTSQNWTKATFSNSWDNLKDDSVFAFSLFKETLSKINEKKVLFLIVLHREVNKRSKLYIKHNLEKIKVMLYDHYGDNKTNFLMFCEQNRSLLSLGSPSVTPTERRLARPEDVVPVVSTLLSVQIPYTSLALLPLTYLNLMSDKAYGQYCNALNVIKLAEATRQHSGLLQYLTKSSIKSEDVARVNSSAEGLLKDGHYHEALYLAKKLLNVGVSMYVTSKQSFYMFIFAFVITSALGWTLLLSLEYLLLTTPRDEVSAPTRFYVAHFVFIFLSLVMVSIPFLQNLSHTYHFYFQTPIIIFWLVYLKFRSLPPLKIWKSEKINSFLLFLSMILLLEEYFVTNDEMVLPLSICLVALLPSWPKFRKVPFVFISLWYVLSSVSLGSLFLIRVLEPGTKYMNLSGTIWLMLSGISILWVSTRKDTIIICGLTCCLGAAIWLQNACFFSDNKCQVMMYCSWPLFLAVVLPAFGKSCTINKVIHCTVGLAVPVLLTSVTIEPIFLLLILGYTASWAAVESFYSICHWDNLRRVVVIIYMLLITEKLTTTDPVAFRCLLCDSSTNTQAYLFVVSVARSITIFSSVLTTYRLILGSHLLGYSSAILAALVVSLSALRTLLSFMRSSFDYDLLENNLSSHIRVNAHAVVLTVSYCVAMIYARNNKHLAAPSKESFQFTAI